MADIFISYARADRDKIENLAAALEAKGYSVWWDRHIEGGAEFSKDIEAAIKEANAVIVAWSAEAIDSHWVRDEAVYARDHEKMIPITLDDTEPPMGFRQVQAIDFTGASDEAIAAILRAVKTRTAKTSSQSAPKHSIVPPETKPPVQKRIANPKALAGAAAAFVVIGVISLVALRGGDDAPEAVLADAEPETQITARAIAAPFSEKSIAVLPFANRSPNPDDAFFAEGMHDDLLTQLSKIGDMFVTSRTSVMRYAGTEKPIPEIAAELGVATIMEGGVQRAGNRVRINVQLIDGETDAHLWAEIYDRELTAENVFDIQSEITLAIANALHSVLTSEDKTEVTEQPTTSLAAYDAYLRGKRLLGGSEDREELDAALAAFDEAINADPNFAEAYAAKAQTQLFIYWNYDIGNRDWVTAARETLDEAETLAPESVETLVVLGDYYYHGFSDYDRAGEYIDRALVKAPNDAGVWALKGFVARRAGRFDESTRALEKALKLDPLSVDLFSNLAATYLAFGEFEKARAQIEHFRAVAPQSIWLLRIEVLFWTRRGMWKRALDAIEAAAPPREWGEFQIDRMSIAALIGDQDLFDQVIEDLPDFLHDNPNFSEAYDFVRAAGLYKSGRKQEARRIFEEIRVRIAALENPYPRGWRTNVYILPVALPGYLGDLDGVRAAEADSKGNGPEDAWNHLLRSTEFAAAFAMAGDPDTAFDYLDQRTRIAGPSYYLWMRNEPRFDNLRDHPRYARLKADFEAWAEKTGYAE